MRARVVPGREKPGGEYAGPWGGWGPPPAAPSFPAGLSRSLPSAAAVFAGGGTPSALSTGRNSRCPSPTRDGVSGRQLMPGVHQRGHVEPVLGDAGLLGLIEVPALLAREARARERRLGRVLELHVDHDDRRDEATVLAVVDHVGALEGLRAEAHVVDPDLPELAGAVVDVGERDDPRLLVDEDDALAVGVLRQLGDALDHVDVPLLPRLVERPVDLVVPFHRVVLCMVAAQE